MQLARANEQGSRFPKWRDFFRISFVRLRGLARRSARHSISRAARLLTDFEILESTVLENFALEKSVFFGDRKLAAQLGLLLTALSLVLLAMQ